MDEDIEENIKDFYTYKKSLWINSKIT